MVSHNPMRVSWPVTVVAVGLFVWGLWTMSTVWQSMGPLFGPGDAVSGDFVGPNPVVGLIGLVVLAVFIGAIVALIGEIGSSEQTVSTDGQ
ncbi:hypothetical protein ACERIT_13680 [Halopenitus sp. H-Gu1]|uniref:hypothetical protein n=1 Tax=Halopenitus sp. H-Gu1 TaxID=3242697 RepID=UPI00359D2987